MMRRVTAILLFCLLVTMPLGAYADLVVEQENDFYKRYQNQMVYLGRDFIANGEDGMVSVKKAPGAKSNATTIQNGTITYMQYSCFYDGEFWGFTVEYSGWVKLNQMLVMYDCVAFEEDHFDELYRYNGDYAEIKETRAAIAWPWPGADAPLWTVEDLNVESFKATYAYTDNEGREWGLITYLSGNRSIWVCLTEPLNSDIPVFNPEPKPSVWVSETAHTDIKLHATENDFRVITVIIVLVIALVIGTVVLIRVVWKTNKTKMGGEEDE